MYTLQLNISNYLSKKWLTNIQQMDKKYYIYVVFKYSCCELKVFSNYEKLKIGWILLFKLFL